MKAGLQSSDTVPAGRSCRRPSPQISSQSREERGPGGLGRVGCELPQDKNSVRPAGGEDRRQCHGVSTSAKTGIPLGSPASPALLLIFTEPLIEECPMTKIQVASRDVCERRPSASTKKVHRGGPRRPETRSRIRMLPP